MITLPLIVAGVAAAAWLQPEAISDHLFGAALGYGGLALVAWMFRRFRGVEALGLGDAKLCAAGGAWLGWQGLASLLLLACLGGLVQFALLGVGRGREGLKEPVPFGVPLAVALWLVWTFGTAQVGPAGGLSLPSG